jgi:hypothetical protein
VRWVQAVTGRVTAAPFGGEIVAYSPQQVLPSPRGGSHDAMHHEPAETALTRPLWSESPSGED